MSRPRTVALAALALVVIVPLALALVLAFAEGGYTNAVDSWLEALQLIAMAGLFWGLPAFLVGAAIGCLVARTRAVPSSSPLGSRFELVWLAVLTGSVFASGALLAAIVIYKVG